MENQDIDNILDNIWEDIDHFDIENLKTLSNLLLNNVGYMLKRSIYISHCVDKMSISYSNTARKFIHLMNFIDSIKKFEKDLSLKTKNLKEFMLKEIPEYFCDDYEGNYEICILEPINRQIHNFQDDEPENVDEVYLNFIDVLHSIRQMNKINYVSISRYLDKITNKMNYSKSLLLKYELVRHKKLSTKFLDILINEEFLNYIKNQEIFKKWTKEIKNPNVDWCFMSYNNRPFDYINMYMRDIYGIDFHFTERLPVSVLEYMKQHPEHKAAINKGRSIFGNGGHYEKY